MPNKTDKAADIVKRAATFLLQHEPNTGGSRPFYSPEEWKARGEDYGLDSALILCHDGGEYAQLLRYAPTMQRFLNMLLAEGYILHFATSWYSYLMPVPAVSPVRPHVIRYVVTHLGRDLHMQMTRPYQGRNTHATVEAAQTWLDCLLKDNTAARLAEVYGKQALGTFRVNSCRCYPEHFDPMQVNFSQLEVLDAQTTIQ